MEIPTAPHIESSYAEFTVYGDEGVGLELKDGEVFQSVTDTQVVVNPDIYQFDTIQIDYIQGVSLNDFGRDYWYAIQDNTKSEYDNGFTTDEYCYRFVRTEKNSFIMIKGPLSMRSTIESLYNRILED